MTIVGEMNLPIQGPFWTSFDARLAYPPAWRIGQQAARQAAREQLELFPEIGLPCLNFIV
jgi:hypothetical protein